MIDSPHDDGFLSLDGVADASPIVDPDESELGRLRDFGKGLVNYLFMSMRTLAIHDSKNAAVNEPLSRLAEVLEELSKEIHRTHFITVEGQIYLNDLRIKMEASAYGNINYLVNVLNKHGIGGITFNRPLPLEDLKPLVLLLLNTRPPAEGEGDPLEHIREELEKADIPGVDFDRPYYFKSGEGQSLATASGDAAAEQEVAALSYAKGVLAVKDYFRAVEAAETANPLRIRKIVHDLVDVSEDAPDDFLKLHTIHGIEDPYYNHCVNVASLAVAIGRELQLSRVELAELGAAAMFHDLGYAAAERDVEGASDWDDERRMRYHPIAGFKALLRQGEYGPGLMRRLLVTLEHHMHFRRPGGFPNLGKKRLSVFTRIVQVADHYDALITPAGQDPGLLPARALERIIAARNIVFDPVVVKALINVVGRYPYGSLVLLTSNEIGVVTSGGRTAEAFVKPIVTVVRNADGSECDPRPLDLAEDRVMRRRVAEVLDPHGAGITPHAVLFEHLGDDDDDDDEGAAAVDADSWTKAIWGGEDTSTLITEAVGSEDDDLGDWQLPSLVGSDGFAEAPPTSEPEPAPEPEPAGSPVGEPEAGPEPEAAPEPVAEPEATPEPPAAPPEVFDDQESHDFEVAAELPPLLPDPPADDDPDSEEFEVAAELPPLLPDPPADDDPDSEEFEVAAELPPLLPDPPEPGRAPEPWEQGGAVSAPELGMASATGGFDPWGFDASGTSSSDVSSDVHVVPALTEEWEEEEGNTTGAEGWRIDQTGPAENAPPPPQATPGDTQESQDAPGSTTSSAQWKHLTDEEIAAKKAAWKKAMAEAWAQGGEAAVRNLASRTWYDFDQD